MIAFLDHVERILLVIVARIGPWLAPVGPSYAVARATMKHLLWPEPVAWMVGISVEAVGIATAAAMLRAYGWNRDKRKGDPPAPTWLAAVAFGAYLVVGITLAVLVEVLPGLVVWAPASLFVLAGVGYGALAMEGDQTRREADVIADKAQARADREMAKAEKTRQVAQTESHIASPVTTLSDYDAFVALMASGNGDRPATAPELSRQHGVNLRTAQRWWKRYHVNK